MAPNLKFQADKIRKSGNLINRAINTWSTAPQILDGAILSENCFGVIGEELGLRAEYERLRARTILKLNDGTETLIANREAVYTTADRYEHNESKTVHEVKRVPGHRPEIDNDGSGYESRYGWARDDGTPIVP